MTIAQGDTLPDATFLKFGDAGPEEVALADLTKGRKVVLFGLPGAFSRTCSASHLPSFIRTKDAFGAKGVDDIICVAVNDPFVMASWGEATGAHAAGLHLLADPAGEFTRAIGMEFDAPPVGFHGRCKRFAMVVEDGKVTLLHAEENPGVCEVSGGEAVLDAM